MGIFKILILAETNSCPRYTTTKIYKNLVNFDFYDFSNCVFSYSPCAALWRIPSSHLSKSKNPQMGIFKILILAETKGFEPLIRGCRIHDFESRAFNRSATSP